MDQRTSECPCGHAARRAPRTQREALDLASHQRALADLLVEVDRDPRRWLRVLRCRRCDRYWAEDSMSSGHAEMFYVYPIDTSDPRAWLAGAQPLRLPPR